MNLPLGYKKQFDNTGVWMDCGVNLNLIGYRHANYDYAAEHIFYPKGNTSPPIITDTYEKDKKEKFYFYLSYTKKEVDKYKSEKKRIYSEPEFKDMVNIFLSNMMGFYFKFIF